MRLGEIAALRFGALEDACVESLGKTLTVVLGPNESGKSTLMAMVRGVLYGWPKGSTNELQYKPADGAGRHGRLVFEDGDGRWSVERSEGAKGGPVSVTALAGDERPGLLADVVQQVSEQEFRVVFGFGLDEIARLSTADGSQLLSRLIAAELGLDVNPVDVQRQILAAAEKRYKPGGKKQALNQLAKEVSEVQAVLRTLEQEAGEMADLEDLVQELEGSTQEARERRNALDREVRALERDRSDAVALAERLSELEEQAADLRDKAEEARRAAGEVAVDESLLERSAELEAILRDRAGRDTRLERARDLEAQARSRAADVAGMGELPAVRASSVRTELAQWRTRLSVAADKERTARDGATEARSAADATKRVASATRAEPAPLSSTLLWVGAALIALGAVGSAVGLLTEQSVGAALGALVLVAGVGVLFLRSRSAADDESGLSAEAARLEIDAQAAVGRHVEAERELSDARAAWADWLAAAGLGALADKSADAVADVVEDMGRRDSLEADRARLLAEAQGERTAAREWAEMLVAAVPALGTSDALDDASITALAARVEADLSSAQDAFAKKAAHVAAEVSAGAEAQRIGGRIEAIEKEVAKIADRYGGVPSELGVELDSKAADAAASSERADDDLTDTVARLAAAQTRLDAEGRSNDMNEGRQRLEGLRARAVDEAERYVTEMLAAQLLDRARVRFESERQPEVLRRAGEVFSEMTGGRYVTVRNPIGETGFAVVDADSGVHSADTLSRGAAEQLYLALRIGLVRSLGTTGAYLPVLMDDVIVNFDPERREGAAKAIAELGRERQTVYFTCHPETAEVLRGAAPEATFVELDRCDL